MNDEFVFFSSICLAIEASNSMDFNFKLWKNKRKKKSLLQTMHWYSSEWWCSILLLLSLWLSFIFYLLFGLFLFFFSLLMEATLIYLLLLGSAILVIFYAHVHICNIHMMYIKLLTNSMMTLFSHLLLSKKKIHHWLIKFFNWWKYELKGQTSNYICNHIGRWRKCKD